MSEHRAEIIPFPIRPAPQTRAPESSNGTDAQVRLSAALARLDSAMREQQAAMETWRASLTALKQSAHSLEAGLYRYHEVLGTLGERVDGLGATAKQLESWADSAAGVTLS